MRRRIKKNEDEEEEEKEEEEKEKDKYSFVHMYRRDDWTRCPSYWIKNTKITANKMRRKRRRRKKEKKQ